MYPILFQLGPIHVYSFGVFLLLGFIVSLFILNKLSTKAGLRIAFIYDYLLSIGVAGVVVGRLMHVLFKWELYRHHFIEALYVWDGGISLLGALLGSLLYFRYICLRHHQPFLHWMDTISVSVLVMLTYGYVGFALSEQGLSGAALGVPTTMPWGVSFEFLSSPYTGTPLHPLALYMAAACTVTGIVLFNLKRSKKLAVGMKFYIGIAVFTLMIIITELLKWDISYVVWKFNATLILAVLLLLGTIWSVIRLQRQSDHPKTVSLE